VGHECDGVYFGGGGTGFVAGRQTNKRVRSLRKRAIKREERSVTHKNRYRPARRKVGKKRSWGKKGKRFAWQKKVG